MLLTYLEVVGIKHLLGVYFQADVFYIYISTKRQTAKTYSITFLL